MHSTPPTPKPEDLPVLPNPPRPILAVVMLASLATIAIALTACGLAVLEVLKTPKINQLYFLAAFELIAIFGAAVGVLTALNRFKSGPALAMLSVSGPMIVGALLGEPSLSARLLGQPVEPMVLSGVPIKWLALAQLGCGVIMLLCASLTVFARDPKASFSYLGRSAIAAVPLVTSVAMVKYLPVMFPSAGTAVKIGVSTVAFFVFVAFLSIAGHCLIRAYECGRPEEYATKPSPPAPGPGPATAASASPAKA